jgi:hypothetical protein
VGGALEPAVQAVQFASLEVVAEMPLGCVRIDCAE